ncbi:MAG: helical backbone metal receptor [Myxococcota bacterium]
MRNRTFIPALCAFALALAMGCERSEAPKPAPPLTPEPARQATEERREPLGGRVLVQSERVPEEPARIVSLAPSLTETLFALGAGARVVGVTRFCDYPAEAKTLPKIGGFNDHDVEAILALNPDLVMGMASGQKSKLPETLASFDIPHVFFQMRTIEETLEGVEQVGSILGEAKGAEELVASMRADFRGATRDVPESSRPTALFVMGRKPLVVAGPGTFGHEFIERAGGRNAAGALQSAYPMLDAEQVIALNPEVIVDATMLPGRDTGHDASFWGAFEGVAAVKSGRVRTFSDASLLRPGPRLGEALKRFGEAFVDPQEPTR